MEKYKTEIEIKAPKNIILPTTVTGKPNYSPMEMDNRVTKGYERSSSSSSGKVKIACLRNISVYLYKINDVKKIFWIFLFQLWELRHFRCPNFYFSFVFLKNNNGFK